MRKLLYAFRAQLYGALSFHSIINVKEWSTMYFESTTLVGLFQSLVVLGFRFKFKVSRSNVQIHNLRYNERTANLFFLFLSFTLSLCVCIYI